MAKHRRQAELEGQVIEAEAEWKAWLLTLFGTEEDARYIRTVKLLDGKLEAADALAGYLVDSVMGGKEPPVRGPVGGFRN